MKRPDLEGSRRGQHGRLRLCQSRRSRDGHLDRQLPPAEGPDGGPNFYEFGDDVLYEINIDNDGDGIADIVYQFQFTTTLRDPSYFLYNVGPITSLNSPNWNRVQTYSLQRVDMPQQRVTVLGTGLLVRPATSARSRRPTTRLWPARISNVGQRTRALPASGLRGSMWTSGQSSTSATCGRSRGTTRGWSGTGLPAMAAGVNATDMVNVHSLALQVPIRS